MNVVVDVVAHSDAARRQTDQPSLFRIRVGRLHHIAAQNGNNLADSFIVPSILIAYILLLIPRASGERYSRFRKQQPCVSRRNDRIGFSARGEGFPEGSLPIPSSLF